MRISGGEFCGRKLKAPTGSLVRPTQDRVREALFSMLMEVVPGADFVDLYAGSGIVGLEAFSRGAQRVVWVERAPESLACLKANLAALAGEQAAEPRFQTVRGDAVRWLKGAGVGRGADIVFADPPYAIGQESGFEEILHWLAVGGVVRPGGFFACETPAPGRPAEVPAWELWRDRRYGRTRLLIYRLLEGGAAVESETPLVKSAAGGE